MKWSSPLENHPHHVSELTAYYDVPFVAFINVLGVVPAFTLAFQGFTRGINHPLFWVALIPAIAAVAIATWVARMQYRACSRLIAEGPDSQDGDAPRAVALPLLMIALALLTASVLGMAKNLEGAH